MSNMQQQHPSPQKTWSTAFLFCTSLLLKLNRRWHLPLHSREQENTVSAWFCLCCSWTVQRLNVTYLVFCGLDPFCGLPEWISLSTGSEEQIGQCTRGSTTMEAVGNVHKYPGICCGCCNTVMCQITVSECRTPASGVRVLCAFSWEGVLLLPEFLGLSYIFNKDSNNISTVQFKNFSLSSWIVSKSDKKPRVIATKTLFAPAYLSYLLNHVLQNKF